MLYVISYNPSEKSVNVNRISGLTGLTIEGIMIKISTRLEQCKL